MSIVGYQSNSPNRILINKQRLLSVPANHLNPNLVFTALSNSYAIVNENLVIGKDIRLRSRSGRNDFSGWQVSLPSPLVANQSDEHSGILLSVKGNQFLYAIDNEGRVLLFGSLKDNDDELILNFNPYIAQLPLNYKPFPDVSEERKEELETTTVKPKLKRLKKKKVNQNNV